MITLILALKAFLVTEQIQGSIKLCIYDYAGQQYVITRRIDQLCPLTIDVD